MDIKHYIGDNVKDIMDQIKAEMGPDAIILHKGKMRKKGIKGLFSKPMIEIVAAYDKAVNENVNVLDNRRFQAMEFQLNKLNATIEQLANANNNPAIINNAYSTYVEMLCSNGVDTVLATEIVDKAAALSSQKADICKNMRAIIKEYLGEPVPINLDNDVKNVIIFLGSTGVGKTTTLAKLAAYYGIQLNKKLALITTDTYRIAAVEQLRTYSEIMQLPLSVAYSLDELAAQIAYYKGYDMIMIDTPGRSPKDIEGIDYIKKIVKISEPTDVFLLINASTNYNACKRLWGRFSDINDIRLLFTKLDETDSLGTILNMRHLSNRPLSYVTNGQVVPDDICVVDVDSIANGIVRE